MGTAYISGILVGGILAASAAGKWSNLKWFTQVVLAYRLVPRPAAGFVALAITLSETVLALMLILAIGQPFTSLCAMALIGLVSGAVLLNLLRGRSELGCGCSGPHKDKRISWFGLMRNVGLLLLSFNSAGTSLGTFASTILFGGALILIASPQIKRLLEVGDQPLTTPS